MSSTARCTTPGREERDTFLENRDALWAALAAGTANPIPASVRETYLAGLRSEGLVRRCPCLGGDWSALEAALKRLPRGSQIVHGDARGADRMAGSVAGRLGHFVARMPAE